MREQINKLGFNIAKPIARWFLSDSTRVRALIIAGDEILLVRSWIGSQRWTLPGGGVSKNEKPKKTLKRELCEELDLKIHQKNYERILKHKHQEHGADFTIIIYQIELPEKQNFKIRKSEIIEAGWHKVDKLNDDFHPLVSEALKHRKK